MELLLSHPFIHNQHKKQSRNHLHSLQAYYFPLKLKGKKNTWDLLSFRTNETANKMKAELLMGVVTQTLPGWVSIGGLVPAVEIQEFGQSQWHKARESSSHWLWMAPLKLLQILTGGGNGWELGWRVYGILLPKAFWIMMLL